MMGFERSLALCEKWPKEGSEGGRETREEAAARVQPEDGEAAGLMEKKDQVLRECVLKLGSTSAWRFQMYETLGSHWVLAATLWACQKSCTLHRSNPKPVGAT